MKTLRRFALASLALGTGACFSPEQPPCSYACSAQTLCPDNYVCLPDGYCHRKDYTGACSFSDASVPPDQAVANDLTGMDTAQGDGTTSADLTGADLTTPVDMTVPADMAGVDMTGADMTAPADMAMPDDMTMSPDMTLPPDMTVLPDLTPVPDLTVLPDMTPGAIDFSDVDMAFQMLAPCGDPMNYTIAGSLIPTVEFGGGQGNNYVQKCLQVSLGAMVTFSGNGGADFGFHPLHASTRGTTPSPITTTTTGTMKTFAFDTVGFYPYFCSNHGDDAGNGMSGVIHVVP